jgi:hypothetical protein
MTIRRMTASVLSLALLLCGGAAVAREHDDDDGSKAKLYLPIAGTAPGGATFAGTLSVLKFSQRDGKPVAIGMVSGSATSSSGTPLGTALTGPIELPVQVAPGPALTSAAPISVQQATTCQVLHLDLGAVNLNVLGLTVATQPIAIDVSGTTGGTNVLGTLICTILETVNNVVGLVNLLNQLLGILGGLTG